MCKNSYVITSKNKSAEELADFISEFEEALKENRGRNNKLGKILKTDKYQDLNLYRIETDGEDRTDIFKAMFRLAYPDLVVSHTTEHSGKEKKLYCVWLRKNGNAEVSLSHNVFEVEKDFKDMLNRELIPGEQMMASTINLRRSSSCWILPTAEIGYCTL